MNRRGISLIEVLVVIAAMGVLLAIAVPAFMSARRSGQDAVSLSNIRQCAAQIIAAAEEDNGLFPHASRPSDLVDGRGQPTVEVLFPGGGSFGFSWFAHSTAWNVILFARGEPMTEAWYSPIGESQRQPNYSSFLRITDYYAGHGFFTDPTYFDGVTRQTAALCKVQSLYHVSHPSNKGLLAESSHRLTGGNEVPNRERLTLRRPLAAVDGHATIRQFIAPRPTVPNSLQGNVDFPVLTTALGVRGLDW